MLSSITPLGERGRASRWPVTVTAHLLGSAAGGTAAGLVLGTLGLLLPGGSAAATAAAAAVVALALWALAVETGRLPAPPTWHRQVDEDWLHRYRGWVYGAGYGVQLGLGVVTIVTSPVLYVAFALVALTGDPARGAALGLLFGLARALPVLAARRVTTPARLVGAHRALERLAPTGRAVTALACAATAAAGGLLLVAGATG
ncbi:hypothetical protein [Kineococcus terrestris]|uniref:hypothetical protein n=1 Tax=Kineococcus terrestris TaxID=2044856 RepID=UPI0034DACCCD